MALRRGKTQICGVRGGGCTCEITWEVPCKFGLEILSRRREEGEALWDFLLRAKGTVAEDK